MLVWEWDMMFEGKWNGNFEKDQESNVWCKTDGEKEDRGPNGDVGIEGNSGSEQRRMEWDGTGICVEERWWACFEKSIGVWSEGQEEVRTTKEDVVDTRGEGE